MIKRFQPQGGLQMFVVFLDDKSVIAMKHVQYMKCPNYREEFVIEFWNGKDDNITKTFESKEKRDKTYEIIIKAWTHSERTCEVQQGTLEIEF